MDTREQILDYIKSHPGAHLRQIKRDLDISMGTTQYHLYALEKENRVLSQRSGIHKRFFVSFVFGEHQREILDILSQETERDLLFYLIQHPGASQKELSNYARISAGTVNWHMKRLISSGLVAINRDAQLVKYTVKGEPSEILTLIRSYHPTLWQSWVDRIADAISDVTQTDSDDVKTQGASTSVDPNRVSRKEIDED